jgi:hypothetical protein
MCKPVPCACGKTTWEGCGDHIESVRVQVPADQWCPGHDDLLADQQIGHQQV